MSYGYGIKKVPRIACEWCGEEFEHGDKAYDLGNGFYICEYCINDYLDDWKKEHETVLTDANDYSMEE